MIVYPLWANLYLVLLSRRCIEVYHSVRTDTLEGAVTMS